MRERRPLAVVLGLTIALGLGGCATSTSGSAPLASTGASPSPTASASFDTGKAAGPQEPVGSDAEPDADVVPVRIVIPRIEVDASLLDLQRGADGALQAPPSNELDKAGWYAKGTVPGDIGPAVIAGHVDWVDRVAVFHRLGELRAGDEVRVVMSDRSTVRFTVDRTRSVSKFHFPTKSVYGPTPDAQLRVITCGGPWDDARNIYSENVIVYADRAA